MARRGSFVGSLLPILLVLVVVGSLLTAIDVAGSRGKEHNPQDIGLLKSSQMLVWGSALVLTVLCCFGGFAEGSSRYWD